MSRIKGHYMIGGFRRDRWLDTTSGYLFIHETGGITVSNAFKKQSTGVWTLQGFTFFPDVMPVADWYVLRHVPEGVYCGEKRPASTQCSGPFVEAVARTKAVGAVKVHRGPDCRVSVVQIKQGDTYNKVTPTTPEPTYNWS